MEGPGGEEGAMQVPTLKEGIDMAQEDLRSKAVAIEQMRQEIEAPNLGPDSSPETESKAMSPNCWGTSFSTPFLGQVPAPKGGPRHDPTNTFAPLHTSNRLM